ncbi:MAG: FAD-dependent oxidoreductase [Desulfobacterales bacterium]
MKTVAVFGAGIAGLSSAHEFARLGYKVSVYEANRDAGGFFRSARMPDHENMPSEYSWHGFGPWYHNVFDVMKQIPFDETENVYNKGLSRPIDFGVAPDKGKTEFNDSWILPVSRMLRMSGLDSIKWGWLMFKTWTSNRRTFEHYSRLNASEQWKPLLSNLGWRTWRATYGPWVGSDWTNVSLHTVGQFFRKLLLSRPSHLHIADEEGPAWTHSQGDGWLLLRGPSSECWFDKWIAHLEKSGVDFSWEQSLYKLEYDGKKITAAQLATGDAVQADIYVLATNPFAAATILERTPDLADENQLSLFKPLTQDGPHTQVSFRIAFSEKIAWPRKRTAVIIADSEYNLTLFAEEQAWAPDVDLGAGVESLWTGTACVGTVPGRLYGLPVIECTKKQFIDEVKAQLFSCEGLDALIKEANNGRSLGTFPIVRIEVWHEWLFSPTGIKTYQPKWVTTSNTQPYQPTQATSIPNLVLAGAHTKTEADVWSIEGAVESGRRAAQAIEPSVKVIPQYKSQWLRVISAIDDIFFSIGAPHALNFILAGILITLTVLLIIGL